MPSNFYYLDESGLSHLWDLVKQLVGSGGIVLDSTPTQGSTNGVTSGGVYTALTGKQDALTFETEPVDNSANPVTSNGIFEAIKAVRNAKQDKMQGGTITMASVSVDGTRTESITFDTAFDTVPVVLCCLQSTQTVGMGRCSCVVTATSKTGFTVVFTNNFTSARNLGAFWMAMA